MPNSGTQPCHRASLVSLPLEIQKHPAAVAHRQMLALHARQFPAAQGARDQHCQQRPVPHSPNAVRVRRLQ
jgi:hypothetical protein